MLDTYSNQAVSNAALKSSKLPSRIKVLNWGKNETTKGLVYLNDQTLEVFDENLKKSGRFSEDGTPEVAIDFDHCTVEGSDEYVKGAPKAIAGYGAAELIPGDGLYLNNIRWTPMGEKFAKNYIDISPAPTLDRKGVVTGLHSVGLTPNGAIDKLHFYNASMKQVKEFAVNDKAALKDIKELEEHEKSELAGVKTHDSENTMKKLSVHNMDDAEHDPNDPECDCAHCMDAKSNIEGAHPEIMTTEEEAVKKDAVPRVKGRFKDYDAVVHKDLLKDFTAGKSKKKKFAEEKVQTHGTTIGLPMGSPPAYAGGPEQDIKLKPYMQEKLKALAAELGLDENTAEDRILDALLAEWRDLKDSAELEGPLTNKENSTLKNFSAQIDDLNKRIATFEAEKAETIKRLETTEKKQLIDVAVRQGKVIPFNAKQIETVSVEILTAALDALPKNQVPLYSQTRVTGLNAKDSDKKGLERAASAFQAQIETQ